MTISELGVVTVEGIKKAGSALVKIVTTASIGDLIKAGILIGTVVITVGLGIKKLLNKRKLWKKEREMARIAQANAMGDIASDDSYENLRREMRSHMVKDFADNLRKKTKAYKRLSKEERDQLDEISSRMDQEILGDDYDPEVKYTNPFVVKRYIHDAKRMADQITLNRARVEAVGYADRDTLPRIWHGMEEI